MKIEPKRENEKKKRHPKAALVLYRMFFTKVVFVHLKVLLYTAL
ncbi:hypothetical protein [Metaplanococcus flavidus]|uniref:Uncharacterized protein n=1 Tax=Metaplanococcus flavidus TaxID=569883 RepID=A0ABW3L7U4_9BACL